jgi:uncharacterized RDD family membrane protein YckC
MPPPPPRDPPSSGVKPVRSTFTTVLPNSERAAEWWERALAILIDAGVVLCGFIIAFVVSAVVATVEGVDWIAILAVIAAYVFGPTYFIHHHAVHGQTVGKAVMHIYVCDEESGQTIGYGRAFLRWLLPVLMTVALYVPGLLNILWPLWDAKKQALHDKVVHTAVVSGDPERGRLFDVWKRTDRYWVPARG